MSRRIVLIFALLLVLAGTVSASSLEDQLCQAIKKNDRNLIKELITKGAFPSARFINERLPRCTKNPKKWDKELGKLLADILEKDFKAEFDRTIASTRTEDDDNAGRLQDGLSNAIKTLDTKEFARLIKNGADLFKPDSERNNPLVYAKSERERKLWSFLANYIVGNEHEKEIKEAARPLSGSPISTPKKISFSLPKEIIACQTIETHKRLWTAAMLSRSGEGPSLSATISLAIINGEAIWLKPGTNVTLTGVATGMISQVTVQGQKETWWIPNTILKAANITVPPVDHRVLGQK